MSANRLSRYFHKGSVQIVEAGERGFAANPFAANIPEWQKELYQAAYQKTVQTLEDEWELPDFQI